MNKQMIEEWLDDNRFYWTDGSLKKDGTGEPISACEIHQCFQDLAPEPARFEGQLVPDGAVYFSKFDTSQKVFFYDKEKRPIGDKSAFVVRLHELKPLPTAPEAV